MKMETINKAKISSVKLLAGDHGEEPLVHVKRISGRMGRQPYNLPSCILDESSKIKEGSDRGVPKSPDGHPRVERQEWNIHTLGHLVDHCGHDEHWTSASGNTGRHPAGERHEDACPSSRKNRFNSSDMVSGVLRP